jgi:hypothetical protein
MTHPLYGGFWRLTPSPFAIPGGKRAEQVKELRGVGPHCFG